MKLLKQLPASCIGIAPASALAAVLLHPLPEQAAALSLLVKLSALLYTCTVLVTQWAKADSSPAQCNAGQCSRDTCF